MKTRVTELFEAKATRDANRRADEWFTSVRDERGISGASRLELLAQARACLARIYESEELLAGQGLTVTTTQGLSAHPAARIAQQARAQFLALCRTLKISEPKPPPRVYGLPAYPTAAEGDDDAE